MGRLEVRGGQDKVRGGQVKVRGRVWFRGRVRV